jgi:hypothetical protein
VWPCDNPERAIAAAGRVAGADGREVNALGLVVEVTLACVGEGVDEGLRNHRKLRQGVQMKAAAVGGSA